MNLMKLIIANLICSVWSHELTTTHNATTFRKISFNLSTANQFFSCRQLEMTATNVSLLLVLLTKQMTTIVSFVRTVRFYRRDNDPDNTQQLPLLWGCIMDVSLTTNRTILAVSVDRNPDRYLRTYQIGRSLRTSPPNIWRPKRASCNKILEDKNVRWSVSEIRERLWGVRCRVCIFCFSARKLN